VSTDLENILGFKPKLSNSIFITVKLGIGISFGAVVIRVVSMICLRYLRGSHYLLIQLAYGVWGVCQAFIMCLCVGHLKLPEEPVDWALGFAVGLVGFLGQITLTLALKYETSSVIAMGNFNIYLKLLI